MKKLVYAGMALALAGCSTKASKVSASYVSPAEYAHHSCDQIREEQYRIRADVETLTGKQNRHSKNDKIATGVGLVLFWPALFFLASDDEKEELARAKGRYEALDRAYLDKQCSLAPPNRTAVVAAAPLNASADLSPAAKTTLPSAPKPHRSASRTIDLEVVYKLLNEDDQFYADTLSPTDRSAFLYSKRDIVFAD